MTMLNREPGIIITRALSLKVRRAGCPESEGFHASALSFRFEEQDLKVFLQVPSISRFTEQDALSLKVFLPVP